MTERPTHALDPYPVSDERDLAARDLDIELDDDRLDVGDLGDAAELDDPDDLEDEPDDGPDDGFVSGYADDDDEETDGDLDLEERYALKRVSGLRTELEDITEVEYRQLR